MGNKKYLIIFLLIILVSFSGCLTFITTREKQACLALTHFSSTSIEDCFSQNSCFKDIEKLNFYTSNHLPNEISADLLKYKNHLASTYYYYSITKKEVQEINDACKNNNLKEIADVKVSFFQNIRNTVRHIDNGTEQSLYLIQSYAHYLQEQEIDLIAEEELFDDYILLNNNLNTLTTKEENNTYVSEVNKEVLALYRGVEKLGYDQTYMSEKNMPDLFSYYTKIYSEGLEGVITYVPAMQEFSLFALNSFSQLDDLNNINQNFYTLDTYNFYQTINSFVGTENSLLTDFKEITNNYNENLDRIYLKINEVEKNIDDEQEYLEESNFARYNKLKKDFKEEKITFGYYLSEIKKINNLILENKVNNLKKSQKHSLELLACELVIEEAKEYTSIFYKEKIKTYQESENIIEKLEVCNEIKNIINDGACEKKIELFLKTEEAEKEEFELFVYDNNKQCIETIGNINYKLESNQKIMFFKKILEETKEKLIEVKQYKADYFYEKKIIDIEEGLYEYEKDNINLIIDIDKKINQVIEFEKEIKEVSKEIISQGDYLEVTYINEKYFLKINNPFSYNLEDVSIEYEIYGILSKDPKLIIQGTKLKVNKLYKGDNLFQINIENKKEITYKIIYLSLDESVIKINIKNQVEGLKENIEFIDGFKTNTRGVKVTKNKIYYTTEKENEIILTGNLFEKEIISEIKELTPTKYLLSEKIIIKNKYLKPINQKAILKNAAPSTIARLTNENTEIPTSIENSKIVSTITIDSDQTKEYLLQTITQKEEIYSEIKKLILEINKFKESVFLDVRSETNNRLRKLLDVPYKETYTLTEIELFYNHTQDIEKIRQQYHLSEKKEIEYFIKYQEIYSKEINDKEKATLTKIDSTKYKNIVNAEKEISELLNSINQRELIEKEKMQTENLIHFQELKEKVANYNLEGINIDLLIKDKDISSIAEIINNSLKKKAEEIYYLINPVSNNLDSDEITYVINRTYKLYQDHDLSELYAVNYFSGITKYDAERLEKNMSFLDGVAFNKEISSFQENYDSQEYEKAINSISLETINRINKIKADVENIEKGLDIIKNDAKTEIIEYQKKEYDVEILNLAKKDYEDEKYLNSILLIRKSDAGTIENLKIQQIIIFLIIIVLFSATYAYFRLGNKKKEESHKEKKRKILRH